MISMNKKRILFPINSRGNYAKLKNIILELYKDESVDVVVVLGGSAVLSRYGNITSHLKKHGITIDSISNFVVEGENLSTMAKSSGLVALDYTNLMDFYDPDIVIILADRFECLPIAMIARYQNRCIVHMEGGEHTGSVDDSIRNAITKLSNYHFVCSEAAKESVVNMGEDSSMVFNVGATSFDEFITASEVNLDDVRDYQLEAGTGIELALTSKQYGICIFHPVTTEYGENYSYTKELIDAVHEQDIEFVWIWPNMDAGSDGVSKAIREAREGNRLGNVHFFKSLPIELYAPLLKYSRLIIGNSSSGVREAGFVGVPSVCIGSRQQGRERDKNVFTVNADKNEIIEAIDKTKKIKVDFSSIYAGETASLAASKLLRSIEIVREKISHA